MMDTQALPIHLKESQHVIKINLSDAGLNKILLEDIDTLLEILLGDI